MSIKNAFNVLFQIIKASILYQKNLLWSLVMDNFQFLMILNFNFEHFMVFKQILALRCMSRFQTFRCFKENSNVEPMSCFGTYSAFVTFPTFESRIISQAFTQFGIIKKTIVIRTGIDYLMMFKTL